MKLIYKGSKQGLDFHKYCDNQGPTLTLYKSNMDRVFGGYTPINWQSRGTNFKEGGNSFIFSLRDDETFSKLLHNLDGFEIHDYAGYLPSFSSDIYNTPSNTVNFQSQLGTYYKLPDDIQKGSQEANSYLAGEYNFTIKDVEVYKVE